MIALEDIPVFPLTLKFNMDDDIVSRLKLAKRKNHLLTLFKGQMGPNHRWARKI